MIILFILLQVLLVTGGYNDNDGKLDSTELLRPGSDWQEITSARLPRPLNGVSVITVNNRVLLFGEWRQIIVFFLTLHWPLFQGELMVRSMMTSWSTTRMVTAGASWEQ